MIPFLYSHLQLCLTALAFLSWIPVPSWGITSHNLNRLGMYFPVAGALLGGFTALVLFFAHVFFPYSVAVAITWFAYGLITGAFHDDGLADFADSMGGYEAQKRLEIMRDSRIGTYGAFALISSYVLRFSALSSVNPDTAIRNLIAYAAVARLTGVFFLARTKEIDFPSDSLSRTILFSGQWKDFLCGLFFTALLIMIIRPANLVWIPFMIFLPPLCLRKYCLKKMGCITGDSAGFLIYCTETFLHVLATTIQ